jgi:hypothetical protein
VTRKHLHAEHHGLRMLCYQLGVVDVPPRHGKARDTTFEQRVGDITRPEIRRVVLRYLQTIATTVRPKQWKVGPPPCGSSPAGSGDTGSRSGCRRTCADERRPHPASERPSVRPPSGRRSRPVGGLAGIQVGVYLVKVRPDVTWR